VSGDFDLDAAFTALRERVPRPRFEPAADVRRRGRRRTHRRIAVTAAAVVVLLAGAGALAAGPLAVGPAPPATTVSSRPPTSPAVERDVPNELLLQPDDVPTGFLVGDDRDQDYPQGLPAHFACADLSFAFTAAEHRRAQRRIVFAGVDAMRQRLTIPEEQIQQQVTIYDAGWAAREVADYGAWLTTCPVRGGIVYEVLDTGFGGDESVLYRVRNVSDRHFFLAVVRVGDRLTYLQVGGAFQEATARHLAVRAAGRLGS
jgi:hypothetical protein